MISAVSLLIKDKSATAAAVQHLGRIVRENGALVVRKIWEGTGPCVNRQRRVKGGRHRGGNARFEQDLTLAVEGRCEPHWHLTKTVTSDV